MSRMLAQRLLQNETDDTNRLNLLFTLLSCRDPNEIERSTCRELLQAMRLRYSHAEDDALALLQPVTRRAMSSSIGSSMPPGLSWR